MLTVYSYEIVISSTLLLPSGAEILSVSFQHGRVFLWAKVDTSLVKEARHFNVFGTGHIMPYDRAYRFIGTAHTDNGLVLHVFEIGIDYE